MQTDIVVALIVGILIGYALGRIRPKNLALYAFLRKFYTNLDNFILILSAVVVIGAIYFSSTDSLYTHPASCPSRFVWNDSHRSPQEKSKRLCNFPGIQ